MTAVRWPNGARCAVAITFDVDAEALYLFHKENATRPKTLSMGTYGPLRGVPRILDLLDRQGIRATFFIPGWTMDHWPERTRAIARRGHELAAHGYLHEQFDTLSPDEQRAVRRRSQETAERIIGRRMVGVRPPGEYTPETLGIVREMGFLYDANLRGDDRPTASRSTARRPTSSRSPATGSSTTHHTSCLPPAPAMRRCASRVPWQPTRPGRASSTAPTARVCAMCV